MPGVLELFRPPAPEEPSAVPVPLTASAAGRARTLTAAARRVTPDQGAALTRGSRARAWQEAAFIYQDALPEVGYVVRFLSNNSAHIRLYAGDRPRGADEVLELDDDYGWLPGATPASPPVRDPDALPEDLVEAAREAIVTLTGSSPSGGGASILAPLVANLELVGEAYLVGTYDPDTDRATWAIHSKSEVRFAEGRLPTMDPDGPPGYYRLVTGEGKDAEAVDLDPAYTTVQRMWTASTRWSGEPSSPMKSLAGTCERLLLIERATDAALRSRAAGNGFLLVPEELSPPAVDDDAADEDADQFQADLTRQLVTPLAQDGSAASVTPGVIRGAAEYLKEVRHLTVERPMDPRLAELETRLLTRLGVGLDVPPEVITGYADINHWNVWQVDSDTFKHHQEPITINAVEALTLAFMRSLLQTAVDLGAASWTPEQIERVVIWFDPASLITPPDMREAANDAHAAGTISDAAHRRALGFDDGDAPPEDAVTGDQPIGTTGLTAETLGKLAEVAGSLMRAGYEPDAVSVALGLDIAHTGYLPVTVKPPEEETADEQPAIPAPAPPPEEEPPPETPPPGEEEDPAPEDDAEARAIAAAGGPPVTAASRRLSRRLARIDRTLRERLTTAADAALARALEKAGNRLRTAARANDAPPEARVAAGLPGERIAAGMGRAVVAALGAEERELLAGAFDRFHAQYAEWTLAAAEDAIDAAAQLAGLRRTDPSVMRAVAALRDSFADAVELSWPALEADLLTVAEGALYDPDPSTPELGEVPVTTVPPGVLRAALAVAGGLAADATGTPPLSGLTSGELLSAFLRGADCQPTEYEWTYGISARPFPPHARLDGQVFRDWDAPELRSAGTGAEWVGDSFAPGDHKGCHCDYGVIWSDGGRARAEQEAVGAQAYREQKPGRPVPGHDATTDPRVRTPDRVAVPALRRTERPAGEAATAAAVPIDLLLQVHGLTDARKEAFRYYDDPPGSRGKEPQGFHVNYFSDAGWLARDEKMGVILSPLGQQARAALDLPAPQKVGKVNDEVADEVRYTMEVEEDEGAVHGLHLTDRNEVVVTDAEAARRTLGYRADALEGTVEDYKRNRESGTEEAQRAKRMLRAVNALRGKIKD